MPERHIWHHFTRWDLLKKISTETSGKRPGALWDGTTVELQFLNLIHSRRLFEKWFVCNPNLFCHLRDAWLIIHVSAWMGCCVETKVLFNNWDTFLWTTWSRTKLFKMGDILQPKYDCTRICTPIGQKRAVILQVWSQD